MKETVDKRRSVDRDLSALAARSRLRPLSLEQTIQTLSRKRKGTWAERFMAWRGFLKAHSRLATATAVVMAAVAFLLVPVSYDKVVGHEVSLSLDGKGVNEQTVRGIAAEFKEALDAEGVGVGATMDDGKMTYTLSARASGKNAPRVAETFARALDARGFEAEAASTPIKERVSGNVYAMAVNNVVSISVDGKSEAELEAEIAAQLAAAGIDAEVSVSLTEGEGMAVDIRAERTGVTGVEMEESAEPQIVLTSGGEPLSGEMETETVRIKVTEDVSGDRMVVEVMDNGETYTATVDDPKSLSDGELASRVHELLAAQGREFSVSSEGGRLQVMKLGTPGEGGTGVRKTSWGKLKQKMSEGN